MGALPSALWEAAAAATTGRNGEPGGYPPPRALITAQTRPRPRVGVSSRLNTPSGPRLLSREPNWA